MKKEELIVFFALGICVFGLITFLKSAQKDSLKQECVMGKRKESRSTLRLGKAGALYYKDGAVVEEITEAYPQLKFFYQTFAGKITRPFLRKKAFSKVVGVWQDSRFSKAAIEPFIKRHTIDMNEYEVPQGGYASFNEFFIRKLKAGVRAIDYNSAAFVAPCDSKVIALTDISEDAEFLVKGKPFKVERLFSDKSTAAPYVNGTLFIFRLAPYDYHRYHFPVDCVPSAPRIIKGNLESVNPIAYHAGIMPLTENERHLIMLHTKKFDDIAFFAVGATFVGRIIHTFALQAWANKGEEMGYFAFGGSTVVVLFKKGITRPCERILKNSRNGYETAVKMGEKVADGV